MGLYNSLFGITDHVATGISQDFVYSHDHPIAASIEPVALERPLMDEEWHAGSSTLPYADNGGYDLYV